jgi:glycosyltransferase involved in cell wall biosynthesis
MAFCEGLAHAGHEVAVAAPFDTEVQQREGNQVTVNRFRYIWPDELHIMGHGRSLRADVKLRPLSYLLLPFYLLSAFLKLYRITGQQNSDLIHVHWVVPNGLIAAWVAALRKIPFVVSLHGSDVYLARSNPVFRSIAKYIFQHANGVTACSPELLDAALEMDASCNHILLPYGVDTKKFNPTKRDNKFRQQFKSENDDVIIIALGRLVYKKGFDILITASREVLRSRSGIQVVIGGEGPLRDELEQKINKLGISEQVQMVGNLPWDEVPKYLASGDIFILPSIRDQYGNIDGLPNVLLEAMSSGTPVIASDIPGVKTVIEDLHNGILVPSGNTNQLMDSIILLVSEDSLRETLGEAARITIENNFTWHMIVKRLENLFNLVLNNGRRSEFNH